MPGGGRFWKKQSWKKIVYFIFVGNFFSLSLSLSLSPSFSFIFVMFAVLISRWQCNIINPITVHVTVSISLFLFPLPLPLITFMRRELQLRLLFHILNGFSTSNQNKNRESCFFAASSSLPQYKNVSSLVRHLVFF